MLLLMKDRVVQHSKYSYDTIRSHLYDCYCLYDENWGVDLDRSPMIEFVRTSLRRDRWSECLLGLADDWCVEEVVRAFELLLVLFCVPVYGYNHTTRAGSWDK